MTVNRIHARRLFDGENFLDNKVLTVDDGKIIAIDDELSNNDYLAEGLVVPGFIDLQVNGGGGILFNTSPTLASIKTMMSTHATFGTTCMLPTLITDKIDVMAKAADAIAQALAEKVPGIVGIHFEGPHLCIAKKGAHSEEYIRPISDEEWQVLSRKDMGSVIVTLAPETVSTDDIARMVALGIKVCIGHSNATFEQASLAIAHGASGFTHLFNAMSPLQGREPGVVGSALLSDEAYCGLIVDGHHVDYATCKLAIKTKPKGKVLLVTDAMPHVGTDQINFSFFDRTVKLHDGKLTSTTGELAGSVLDMATAVRKTHLHVNIPLDECLRMASLYPANYLQNPSITGQLCIGDTANFVELDDDLQVISTWINGQAVYQK